jgi:arginyl-tRNA synthetase
MTIIEIQDIVRAKVRETALRAFNVELETVASEIPPKTELGDMAFPVAFELAKRVKQATGEKKNPRELAEGLKAEIETLDFVGKVKVAGAGYLNVFFDRARFLDDNADASPLPQRIDLASIPTAEAATTSIAVKVCVEHTSVNPNKAAHIGHVRNSVIGDSFARILSATGKRVEVQNYIDNTGVQVADVVVGFIYLEQMDLAAIKALDDELDRDGHSFDYYCWDLYARVGQAYQADEELKAKRAEVLHLIEEGNNETAELADLRRNTQCRMHTGHDGAFVDQIRPVATGIRDSSSSFLEQSV